MAISDNYSKRNDSQKMITRTEPMQHSVYRSLVGWKYKVVPKPVRTNSRRRKNEKSKVTKWQMFVLFRRLLVIAAACKYIHISMLASFSTIEVLLSTSSPTRSFGEFTSPYIANYVGKGLINESRLVQDVLGGDTRPRNFTLFLESDTKISVEGCSKAPILDPPIYTHEFLTFMYDEIVKDTNYYPTTVNDLELIVGVVDCSATQVQTGDPSFVRVFNFARPGNDPTKVYLVVVSVSVQDYEVHITKKYGPALVAMVAIIQDMRAGISERIHMMAPTYPYQRIMEFEVCKLVRITEDSCMEMQTIPQDPITEPVKRIITSRKRGFHNSGDQMNVHSTYSVFNDTDAISVLTRWKWIGKTEYEDSWAWVHGIHFVFGMQTIISLCVLGLLIFRNFRAGKLWIGDPFSSLSTATLVGRGLLVMISWYMNSFWTIFEFTMSNAAKLDHSEVIEIHEELVHADVLVVYLGVVGLLSLLIRERIDPSIAIGSFELIHFYRLDFIRLSPAVMRVITGYYTKVMQLGNTVMPDYIRVMSPLNFWSSYQIPKLDGKFLITSFFPKLFILGVVAVYALLRKLHRFFYPEKMRQRSTMSTTQSSTNEKAAITLKGNLTNFEISTGAALQTRFGIISDYNNYVYFKGMKFASADGVYGSGYVIVNGKFLVSSKQLLLIVLIKLVRNRISNVYAYEVQGNTVMSTARLVYPETFNWSDLWHLNVTVLL